MAGEETDLGKVFHEIAPQLKKRGMVVIISDCFGDIPSILKGLAHFNHAKHDVVVFKSGILMNWNFLFEHGLALIALKMLVFVTRLTLFI